MALAKQEMQSKNKKKHNLEYYFNYALSPDLMPIKNCWLLLKQQVQKYSHWDDTTLEELIKKNYVWIHCEGHRYRVSSRITVTDYPWILDNSFFIYFKSTTEIYTQHDR